MNKKGDIFVVDANTSGLVQISKNYLFWPMSDLEYAKIRKEGDKKLKNPAWALDLTTQQY